MPFPAQTAAPSSSCRSTPRYSRGAAKLETNQIAKGSTISDLIKNLPHSTTLTLADQLSVQEGQVTSLTLAQQPGCKVTLFSIDTDEGMSSHAAPGDALILCLEGRGEITIEGVQHVLLPGQSVIMSAGAAHAVRALEPFKMLLTVVLPAQA